MSRSWMLLLVPSTLGACGSGRAIGADTGPARATLPLIVYSYCAWARGARPASGTITVEADGVAIARNDVTNPCDSPRGIGPNGIDGIDGQPVLEGCLSPGPSTVRISFCASLAKSVAIELTVVAQDQDAYLPSCGLGTERVAYTPLKLEIPIEPDLAGPDAGTGCAAPAADATLATVEPCWCAL